ncbi:MAG TPA: hypothetical protein VG433_13765 [Pirellulales bacterium]|nr:hypothetical protein [Pirellulales bacterium]HWC90729.1 hypothetical protein [Pirellulales bacterium]
MNEAGLPVTDVSNLTATAILCWYSWHTATRTLPNIVKAFREEMARMRAEYRSERECLYSVISAQSERFHDDHLAVVEALNQLSNRLQNSSKA